MFKCAAVEEMEREKACVVMKDGAVLFCWQIYSSDRRVCKAQSGIDTAVGTAHAVFSHHSLHAGI